MKKQIYDEKNGLWYELLGDYYLPCLTLPEEEHTPVGVWGQRHGHYLKEHKRTVYSECFVSDMTFRKQISDIITEKFGGVVFDYTQKPRSDEFEIVYAIIDTKRSSIEEKLPFFSKVNLMITAQELDRMHFKFSVCFVRKV